MDFNSFVTQPQPYQFFVPAPASQYTPHDETQYDPLDAFNDPSSLQFFDHDTTGQFHHSAVVAPPQSPPHSIHRSSISHGITQDSSGSVSADMNNMDFDYNQEPKGSSDDDKDNLTPAQSRRKAQNRAAQRAFRERKERHLKDLEIKLKSMEAKSTNLISDNERLKRELDRVATQNEILRATSTPTNLTKRATEIEVHEITEIEDTGHMAYSPGSFSHAVAADHFPTGPDMHVSHRITRNPTTGEKMLATGAAWDYIQRHDLHRRGLVELGDVVDNLKQRVFCDGTGPSFAESAVEQAIQESVGIGRDELI